LFAQRADMTFWHLLIHRFDSDFFAHAIRACRTAHRLPHPPGRGLDQNQTRQNRVIPVDGHETDPAAFWETVVEDAIDKNGEPILGADGKPLTRRYHRLKLFSELEPEHRMLIKSLTYTENGYPNLQVVKKSWANVELRKFLGSTPRRAPSSTWNTPAR
jgi:hypothetical protein